MTGLLSSGVAAQADTTQGPDWTYLGLLATFSWSSHDVCYSNGAPPVTTSGCKIEQLTPTGKANIAICVQVTSTAQQCDITQNNNTKNNYALVIQRINQQGTTASCDPLATTCQDATQRASILQTDVSGSNFAGVIQKVTQSLNEQATDGDPGQSIRQDVRSLAWAQPGGLKQMSAGGSNFAAVGQDSQQYQAGATAQSQTARQVAGASESGRGINQTTIAPGGNLAVLSQVQKQNVQSQVALNQTENAYQDGDITQTGGVGNFHNFASGNQFQDQQERGVVGATAGTGTIQVQLGDPKCCSVQTAGKFLINQATKMFANNAAARTQTETIIGNCDSPPSGCTITQTATLNGTTTPGDPCMSQASCHQGIACAAGSCTPCTPVNTESGQTCTPPPPVILAPVASRGPSFALSRTASRYAGVARSVPSGALLT
jgi:hypothetical protein